MPKQKIYYSFHDMPGQQPYQSGYSTEFTGLKFSRKEIVQILIAMGVLTIAFSFAFSRNRIFSPIDLNLVINYIPLAFLGIVTAFLCHELAHKYVAQRFGYWSEFRMYPQGLFYALFLAVFIGFVFAAPGAVTIFGTPTREENGKMAIAGPLTNIIISLIAISIWISLPGLIGNVAFFIAYINAFLGFFNLLPFGPMDGLKIFSWRREIWIVSFIISIGLLVFLIIS